MVAADTVVCTVIRLYMCLVADCLTVILTIFSLSLSYLAHFLVYELLLRIDELRWKGRKERRRKGRQERQ